MGCGKPTANRATTQRYSVAFSPDGKILALASWYNEIILWDVAGQQAIGQPLAGSSINVNHIAFSPNGKILAVGSEYETIILWDVESQQPIGQLLITNGQYDNVLSVAFSPDGRTLAAGSSNATIKLLGCFNSHQHKCSKQPDYCSTTYTAQRFCK